MRTTHVSVGTASQSTACFGDAWRDRVARVHLPRKRKGTI